MKPNIHMRGEQIVEALVTHGGCYYDGLGVVILHPYAYGFGGLVRAELEQRSIAGVSVFLVPVEPPELLLTIEVLVHTDDDLQKLIELLLKYRALAAVTDVLKRL